MTNIKPTIVAALKNDATLTSLLGGQRIYFQYPPNEAEFPRITYYMLDDRETAHAMGFKAVEETKHLSIDIWSKESTSEIEARVDEIIKGLGYFVTRITNIDLYEKGTNVFHKHMVYEFKVV